MREAGEPMECGIFDFYEVFSRAFGEEGDGAGGSSNGRWGMSSPTSDCFAKSGASGDAQSYIDLVITYNSNFIPYYPNVSCNAKQLI